MLLWSTSQRQTTTTPSYSTQNREKNSANTSTANSSQDVPIDTIDNAVSSQSRPCVGDRPSTTTLYNNDEKISENDNNKKRSKSQSDDTRKRSKGKTEGVFARANLVCEPNEQDKINRGIQDFETFIRENIIGTKFIQCFVPLDSSSNPIYEEALRISSSDGTGSAIESITNDAVRKKKAGKHMEVNELSQSFPDYNLKVGGQRIPVELKVFKGNSFANDLGNLRVILQKMSKFDKQHNDGLDVFLNQAWYVLINYTFDKGVTEPKQLFLKRLWQIAGRGPKTEQLNNGGSGCCLRTNTSTITKLASTPTTNTKESFVEAVLDVLHSPACNSIRNKASISTEDGITMYNSILDQAKTLNIDIQDKYTKIIH